MQHQEWTQGLSKEAKLHKNRAIFFSNSEDDVVNLVCLYFQRDEGRNLFEIPLINNSGENRIIKIRQKNESQNGCYKEAKHAIFSKKTNISYPLDTHCALFPCTTRFEIRPFALLPTTYQRDDSSPPNIEP